MNDAVLAPLEAAVRAAPDNLALAGAYVDSALALEAGARAARILGELGLLARLSEATRLRLGSTLRTSGDIDAALAALIGDEPAVRVERARALLAAGRREDASAAYRAAIADNPTLEDRALAAELDGRVVRADFGRGAAQRLTSVPNDADEGADIVRLTLPSGPRVTFADVGGLDEVKQQIRRRIITPFQKPSLFERFRKKAGGGVLLYGPPGCGKTLLARATAGECGATFYNVAVSDVLDMYIGESERKLHALFEQARRDKPAVLFFDEVEALGGKRQHSREAGTSKLVSQFLSELDGFAQNNEGVLVLAATNVPWAVDPAFRRPGRFDRVLFVPPPDQVARAEILRGLLTQRPVSGHIDIDFVARATSGYSGADLAHVIETAVDVAIEHSIDAGAEVPITDALVKTALKETRATTLEWLTTARNYARYANEGGQYDDVLAFLKAHGKA